MKNIRNFYHRYNESHINMSLGMMVFYMKTAALKKKKAIIPYPVFINNVLLYNDNA